MSPSVSVVCIYDNQKWIGMVTEVDINQEDVLIKFMHPPYPSRSFTWPSQEDNCWVPITNIVCKIATPALSTTSGHQYCLHPDVVQQIDSLN